MKEQHPSSSIGSTSPSRIKKSIRRSFPLVTTLPFVDHFFAKMIDNVF